MEESLKLIENKKWVKSEVNEVSFILNELFDNSFQYGLPNSSHSFINAEVTATSTFIKLRLKDYGQDFNLEKELKIQEALIPDSKKHKGLALIHNITPEYIKRIQLTEI
ncbi:ATP-binding protein [Candidatus Neomarinimicrobiota bacterium]